jgi:TolA-binding protein
MLEGGRPIDAIQKDCHCPCKDMTHQLNTLSSDIEILQHKNKELEKQLESEHEIMYLL